MSLCHAVQKLKHFWTSSNDEIEKPIAEIIYKNILIVEKGPATHNRIILLLFENIFSMICLHFELMLKQFSISSFFESE